MLIIHCNYLSRAWLKIYVGYLRFSCLVSVYKHCMSHDLPSLFGITEGPCANQ